MISLIPVIIALTPRAIVDLKVGGDSFRNGHDTEGGTTSANSAAAGHRIHGSARLNLTGKTVAAGATTNNLHTPIDGLVSKGGRGLQVNGVPAKLDERVAARVRVRASDKR